MSAFFMSHQHEVENSYDQVARAYADHFFDELRHKPLDRALLDAFAEQVGRDAPVLEVGCGRIPDRGLPRALGLCRLRAPHPPRLPPGEKTRESDLTLSARRSVIFMLP